jgi:hypothetical protein
MDLNEDLLDQARSIYGNNPKMTFAQGDFTRGLPLPADEIPYDLYFTSYGTMSHHNDDESAVRLLADIASRVQDYAIVVCDWLGRWSYEWQQLWCQPSELPNMDYVVSYIYEPEERERLRAQLQHLTLRLMSREEIDDVIARASKQAGVPIKPLEFFDRSVVTGRHIDTAEYNPHAQPLRDAVNSLHEPGVRTDLTSLLWNYVPKPGFEWQNDYFEQLTVCWNILIRYAIDLLELYDVKERAFASAPPALPDSVPPIVTEMAERIRLVVEGTGWLTYGLPRENIIEPQLGYALRTMIMDLQQGKGCGHGLVGVFEIDKGAAS